MTTLQSRVNALAKANVAKYENTIKKTFAKEAGHGIHASDVASITFIKTKRIKSQQKFELGTFDVTNDEPLVINESVESYTNNTDVVQTADYKYSSTETYELKWSLTEGVTFHEEVTTSASAEGVGASASVGFTISESQTSGVAHTSTVEIDQTPHVNVPPQTKVTLYVEVKKVDCEQDFTNTQHFVDGVALCRARFHKHGWRTHVFEIPLTRLLKQKERRFVSHGKIHGEVGFSANVQWDPEDLTPAEQESLPKTFEKSTARATDPASALGLKRDQVRFRRTGLSGTPVRRSCAACASGATRPRRRAGC